MNNRLPDRGISNQKTIKKKKYNFTEQLLIFAAVSALFALLVIGSKVVKWDFADEQQMFLLVNITMGMGFLIYMSVIENKLNFSTKIIENRSMYIICLLFGLAIMSNFHFIDIAWEDNQVANIWLIIEAAFVAVAEEGVFRGYGEYCFEKKEKRAEAALIICYVGFYAYKFVDGTTEGIFALIGAIGVGTLMTGIYLRYRKLGANMVYRFILYYLYEVTEINSTSEATIFGSASPIVFIAAQAGMVWFGIQLIKKFNAEGIASEEMLIKNQKKSDFSKAYEDSKEKYKDKVITKAEPKIEANIEKYHEKQVIRNEKKLARIKKKGKKSQEK